MEKTKINKWDLTKLKKFCTTTTKNINEMKRQHFDLWQRQSQYCKVITLQLKLINEFLKKKRHPQNGKEYLQMKQLTKD